MQRKHGYSIGVICTPRWNNTEKSLFPILQEKFNVVFFPINDNINYEQLKRKSKGIKVILNTAADMPNTFDSLEIVKTFEGLSKHVIDSSKSFYYREDKWLFYQTCLKHNLPTPTTYYIPRNIQLMKGKLKEILNEGPVVFKGIFSDTGRAVKRAMNYNEALKAIKVLHKKVGFMPIVAQKYIPHGTVSYRVTLIGGKVVQSVVKYGKMWKEGKLFWKNEKYRLFELDKYLNNLCEKTANTFGIEWCGIDLMKDKANKWYLIEVNSCPSMDFVIRDAKRANMELANYIIKLNKN